MNYMKVSLNLISIIFGIILSICLCPILVFGAPILELEVISSQSYPDHMYTQGLFFDEDSLYISSGLYERSTFSKWSYDGTLQKIFKLPNNFFAEGAVLAKNEILGKDEIYLLTWKENTVLVLDPDTLELLRTHSYATQGWGLALEGERLWRSDGSSVLYPHKIGDFSSAGSSIKVYDGDVEIRYLNELEWDPITGLMLANIYQSDMVAAIDLSDGQVQFWLNAKPLRDLAVQDGLSSRYAFQDVVLNGLAMALDGKSLWLTGKFWTRRYQIAWPPKDFTHIRK